MALLAPVLHPANGGHRMFPPQASDLNLTLCLFAIDCYREGSSHSISFASTGIHRRDVFGHKTWHKSSGAQKLVEPRHKALGIYFVWQLHQSSMCNSCSRHHG